MNGGLLKPLLSSTDVPSVTLGGRMDAAAERL